MAKKKTSDMSLYQTLLVVAGIVIAGLLIYIVQNPKMSPANPQNNVDLRSMAKGNSAPSGPHYNLNLIGVPKGKTASMTGNQGRRIFVPLVGKCNIMLKEGEFSVLDANCTDSNGALFQLPNPDPENDGLTEYSVYARALGKPGGSSSMTTCFEDRTTDPTNPVTYCNAAPVVFVRDAGSSKFTNVTKDLLYVYVDLTGPEGIPDGIVERYNLFNDALKCEDPTDPNQNICFWTPDNNGLKLVQLRFYDISTNVN